MKQNFKGVTLIEILIAMLVLGLASGGIVGAFVFGRQVNMRSQTRLQMAAFGQRLADELRSRVNTSSLEWGIHYDPTLDYDPITPGRQDPIPPCAGTPLHQVTDMPLTDVPTHFRTRWVYYVEDSVAGHRTEQPCGDSPRGRDMDANGTTDLIWTKIQLDWDTVSD